ncbi:MAG: hypothetical protein M3R15_28235, partial [Acidobacteriota bacterium]|nr:hypothetical protein [Acidobacteriota bacterium]
LQPYSGIRTLQHRIQLRRLNYSGEQMKPWSKITLLKIILAFSRQLSAISENTRQPRGTNVKEHWRYISG